MPGNLKNSLAFATLLCAAPLAPWSAARAQQRVIRVMGDDGRPVAFANVTFSGERPRITDEKGEVVIGPAPRHAATADVRRLGYEPWYGKLTLDDTATRALVTLHRISRRLLTITVTDSSNGIPWYLRGFYERMLARQRGIGNGIYLTPEEIDLRDSNAASELLQGLNGVSLRRTPEGKRIAMNAAGTCQMTVLIDGRRACPESGCAGGAGAAPAGNARRGRAAARAALPGDEGFVPLDDLLGANEVAAVEVYPRGASIPASLPAADASCGLVAFWTGGRKTP